MGGPVRRIVVAVVAALAVAIAVTPVAAAPGPAQLQRQINALRARVNVLENYVNFLKRCDTVIPVSRFGTSTEGYLYGATTSAASSPAHLTTTTRAPHRSTT